MLPCLYLYLYLYVTFDVSDPSPTTISYKKVLSHRNNDMKERKSRTEA